MDRKLGIAVIGLHMGYGHFKQANEHPKAQLVGVCDTNQAEVDKVTAEFPVKIATTNFEDILKSPDVDIVSITTPDHYHLEQTLAAFEAGKHVLVEKPMARTVDECAQMVAAARKANKKLMVAHV
ncbi:MAG: Gfo/Idh/MocA family oxidoreductase, partial [Armatimonadia bacterium]